jgi:hypothetical protein
MGHVYFCDLACDRAPKLFCADSHHARLLGSDLQIAEQHGFRLLLRPCLRLRPKAFARRLTLRTPAWLDRFETFEPQSSIVHVYFCDLVGDRFPKHFFADSHHARLLGSTGAKLSNRRQAFGTFTFVTFFCSIASQSTPAWFDRCQACKSQSSRGHVYFCDLVCDRVPKRFCADSHDARLLGWTAAKPSIRRVASRTFTFVTLFAIAPQSVVAQTHMTHACLIRPQPSLQIAE